MRLWWILALYLLADLLVPVRGVAADRQSGQGAHRWEEAEPRREIGETVVEGSGRRPLTDVPLVWGWRMAPVEDGERATGVGAGREGDVKSPPPTPTKRPTPRRSSSSSSSSSPSSSSSSSSSSRWVVPSFMRAVRLGLDLNEGRGSRRNPRMWRMAAVMGESDQDNITHFRFNLNAIRQQDPRFVEVVFSPANNYSYPGSSAVCTFRFCKTSGMCSNLMSTTIMKNAFFHTLPVSYNTGSQRHHNILTGIVNLVSISCEQREMAVASSTWKPLLAFFKTRELAVRINRYAAKGWHQLTATSQVGHQDLYGSENINEQDLQALLKSTETQAVSATATLLPNPDLKQELKLENKEGSIEGVIKGDTDAKPKPPKAPTANQHHISTDHTVSSSHYGVVVPAFLRAVRRGHDQSSVQGETAWNMAASTGVQDKVDLGHFWFNLNFIHEQAHHRFVEVVFSPANTYYAPRSSGMCTFIFCKLGAACSNVVSRTVMNNDLFHTLPINYAITSQTSHRILTGDVKLVSIVCDTVKITIADGARAPLLAFFKTKERAARVNRYAISGWHQLNDTSPVGYDHIAELAEGVVQREQQDERHRTRRSVNSAKNLVDSTDNSVELTDNPVDSTNNLVDSGNTDCRRVPLNVDASDLGEPGIILEPNNHLINIGQCQGSCRERSHETPKQLHFREIYRKTPEGMVDMRIRGADCVATIRDTASAVIMYRDKYYMHFEIHTMPDLTVVSCECR